MPEPQLNIPEFDLEIKQIVNNDPPLILIYGAEGMGKSSLALDAPAPLYIPIAPERPPRHLTPHAVPTITNFQQFKDTMRWIYKKTPQYNTLVIDSIDALEPILIAELCKRNNWASIDSPAYGLGYKELVGIWREVIVILENLRIRKGYTVILTGLATAKTHEEPGAQPYQKWNLRILQRSADVLTQTVDAMLFINTKATVKTVDAGFGQKDAFVEGGGSRWLFADGRPHIVAKNRFNIPDMVLLPKTNPWGAISAYFDAVLEPVAAPPAPIPQVPATAPPATKSEPVAPSQTPVIRAPQKLADMIPPDPPMGLPPLSKEKAEAELGDNLGPDY